MQQLLEVLGWFRFSVGDYPFYLLIISAACFLLERFFPRRKEQKAFRSGFFQDLGWLALNGHIFGTLFWRGRAWVWTQAGLYPFFGKIESLNLLAHAPLYVQLPALLLLKDLLDYGVHNLLHRVPALWQFHKVHHSIEELDFLGNFRFHWVESWIYNTLTYLPLALMGFSGHSIMGMAIVTTVIGHLNHSNLSWSYGPLKYVLNSPELHLWHHDKHPANRIGHNFAVVFSMWDWLFGTALLPEGQPKELGFEGMERFPSSLGGRLVYPAQELLGPDKPDAGSAPSVS